MANTRNVSNWESCSGCAFGLWLLALAMVLGFYLYFSHQDRNYVCPTTGTIAEHWHIADYDMGDIFPQCRK